jgi:hypothetical protein
MGEGSYKFHSFRNFAKASRSAFWQVAHLFNNIEFNTTKEIHGFNSLHLTAPDRSGHGQGL